MADERCIRITCDDCGDAVEGHDQEDISRLRSRTGFEWLNDPRQDLCKSCWDRRVNAMLAEFEA